MKKIKKTYSGLSGLHVSLVSLESCEDWIAGSLGFWNMHWFLSAIIDSNRKHIPGDRVASFSWILALISAFFSAVRGAGDAPCSKMKYLKFIFGKNKINYRNGRKRRARRRKGRGGSAYLKDQRLTGQVEWKIALVRNWRNKSREDRCVDESMVLAHSFIPTNKSLIVVLHGYFSLAEPHLISSIQFSPPIDGVGIAFKLNRRDNNCRLDCS